MFNQSLCTIDASNPTQIRQVLAFNPLLSEGIWRGIHFFNHQVLAGETVAATLKQHLLIVPLGECIADRWVDGHYHQEHQAIGDCFLIPQGLTHRAYKYTDVEAIGIVIEPAFLNQIAAETFNQASVELVPQFCHANSLILHLALELKQDLIAGCPTGQLYGETVATTLVAYLVKQYSVPGCTATPAGLSALQLQQAKDYIDAHLTQNISLSAIAQHLTISQYHFIRLFKRSTGVTPHQYVMQRRLEAAKQLLINRELSIAQISDRLGFNDSSQFTRFFRKQVGTSPGRYRQAK